MREYAVNRARFAFFVENCWLIGILVDHALSLGTLCLGGLSWCWLMGILWWCIPCISIVSGLEMHHHPRSSHLGSARHVSVASGFVK